MTYCVVLLKRTVSEFELNQISTNLNQQRVKSIIFKSSIKQKYQVAGLKSTHVMTCCFFSVSYHCKFGFWSLDNIFSDNFIDYIEKKKERTQSWHKCLQSYPQIPLPGRENMSPLCLALIQCILPLQIFISVTSSLQERESTSLPALYVSLNPQSYISSRGCCHLSSPPFAPSFHSCFHLSGSFSLSQKAGDSGGTDKRTDRERRRCLRGF